MIVHRPSQSEQQNRARARARKHVVIGGAGGNIGSQLVGLVSRMPGIGQLTFLDPDRYEPKNIWSQEIRRSDIGRYKVHVQAQRARRINPALTVVAIPDRLENVPLGKLRGDVFLTCLDSKESRAFSNEIAWRHGMDWIDAGIEPSAWLVRVNVYLPAPEAPCMECFWDDRDYAQLATRHPCQLKQTPTPSSNAPASLGALAASLQAIACQQILAGQRPAAPYEVLLDAANHRQYLTTLRRNPNCRFDHQTWKITEIDQERSALTLGETFALGGLNSSLSFGGKALVERLSCPRCGFTRKIYRLTGRLGKQGRQCARCQWPLLATGFHMQTRLDAKTLSPEAAARSLASVGLNPGDVFSLSDGRHERHFELSGTPIPRRQKIAGGRANENHKPKRERRANRS